MSEYLFVEKPFLDQLKQLDWNVIDEKPEYIEMERRSDLRRCASDLMMLESAKEWLLGTEE